MSYASKELIDRAKKWWSSGKIAPWLIEDLAKATPLPDNWCAPVGDAIYGEYRPDAEHEAAIKAWREEAMSLIPHHRHAGQPDMRVLHVEEIDAICDIARRAPTQPVSDAYKLPAPEPKPEPASERDDTDRQWLRALLALIERHGLDAPREIQAVTDHVLQERGK